MTPLRDFTNRLKIMRSIDMNELVDGGVILGGDNAMWREYQADPFRFLIYAEDFRAALLWEVISSRTSPAAPPAIVPPDTSFPSLLDHPEAYGMQVETHQQRDDDDRADRHTHALNQEWSDA